MRIGNGTRDAECIVIGLAICEIRREDGRFMWLIRNSIVPIWFRGNFRIAGLITVDVVIDRLLNF
jgi:hypothetical protein